MANPKKQRKSTSAPNWTPYLVLVGIIAVVLAIAGNVIRDGLNPSPPKQNKASSNQKSVKELEAQIKTMAVTLGDLAKTGKSGVFTKIGAMAEEAEQWLAKAKAEKNEDKKREILEEGLNQKSRWIGVLGDHSAMLQKEDTDAKQGAAPGHAVELTDKNFAQFIASNSHAMVEFFAPWCGHCKKLKPEFDKAALHWQGKVGFGAVEATTQTTLARVYDISRYPSLKWFVKGQIIDYPSTKDSLTADALTTWIAERLEPAFVEVSAVDELLSAMDAAGTGSSGICVCVAQKDSDLYQAFVAASEVKRNKMIFAFVPAKDGEEGSIRYFKDTKSSEQCEGPSCKAAEGLISWLESQSLGSTGTSSTTTAIPVGDTEELD
jgi:thiol-disulfide isomerase/thioredoxin